MFDGEKVLQLYHALQFGDREQSKSKISWALCGWSYTAYH